MVRFSTRYLDGPVHFADFGGPAAGPPIVLVHGLGGSHATWMAAGPLLARRARVVAIDLAGFGYTPLAGRSARIEENRCLLDRFLEDVIGEPAILVGNSMGGVVTLLQASTIPAGVLGVVLVNPAVHRPLGVRVEWAVIQRYLPLMTPGIGELTLRDRWSRLGPEGLVRDTLDICCVDTSRVSPEVFEAMLAVATEILRADVARRAYLDAFRSLMPLLESRVRFSALLRSVTAPVLLVHGEEDRIVPVAAALAVKESRPDWDVAVLPGIGHTPQAEDPVRFTEIVLRWLEQRGVLGNGRRPRSAGS